MKLLLVLTILSVLASCIKAVDYISIVPYGDYQCGDVPAGRGFYVPLNTCINLFFQDTYFEIVDGELQVSFSPNCGDEDKDTFYYDLEQCTIFKLKNTANNYASIISLTSKPPADAISYNYYFTNNKNQCSGNYFQVYQTNGSKQNFYQYYCENNVVKIYNCYNPTTGSNECQPINVNSGCNQPDKYYDYPNDITC
ncbi:hypothetical protein DICPUDRAFT_75556 [Dictyostelium purpureum]|uniref:Uncharacterized protein n=1 Tax=Dictyostelium purpureum TaxID=5786 RepID=F0ZB02_DICPU|nr:uncharacterized protein DICPUDRAFT_75556 [Dictyostelium purpureum]EGC38888.1 hypothetical protein DICPUDRAFT_75556 [Dictyostelium purpureum]|eukprot:XP_003284568.1 hypothetical protein DICPUDRAFT_75556 [Dictyostelium purpureum]